MLKHVTTRPILLVFVVVAALALIPFALRVLQRRALAAEYAAYLAHLDATDPGWRLRELNDARTRALKPDRIGLRVAAAASAFDATRPMKSDTGLRPAAVQAGEVREHVRNQQAALQVLLEIRDDAPPGPEDDVVPGGLKAVEHSTHSVLLVRPLVELLALDAYCHAAEGRAAEAARRLDLAARVAHRNGDTEFSYMTLLIRIGQSALAADGVERVLATAPLAEADLLRLQTRFLAEDASPAAAAATRGERAFQHEITEEILTDGSALADYAKSLSDMKGEAHSPRRIAAEIRATRLSDLQALEQIARVAGLPAHERRAAIPAQTSEPTILGDPVGSGWKVVAATVRHAAVCRVTAVAIACERYRAATGRFPQSQADLVPRYLPAVELDPYDGRPIRLRDLPEGLTVYSIAGGFDGESEAKNGDDQPRVVRFRLLHPARRGRL